MYITFLSLILFTYVFTWCAVKSPSQKKTSRNQNKKNRQELKSLILTFPLSTNLVFIFKRNNLLLKFFCNIFFFFFHGIYLLQKLLKNVARIHYIYTCIFRFSIGLESSLCTFNVHVSIKFIPVVISSYHNRVKKVWTLLKVPFLCLSKFPTQVNGHPANFQFQLFQRPDFVFFLPIP